MERKRPRQAKKGLARGGGMNRTVIRSLSPGEPDPAGEPKRYRLQGYVRLRWKVAPYTYVERYERDAAGSILRTIPKVKASIDDDQIRVLYEGGKRIPAIAAETGWDRGALSRSLSRSGVAIRPPDAGSVDVGELVRLYVGERRSLHDTTRLAGAENVHRVAKLLREAGVAIRRPGRPLPDTTHDEFSAELVRMRPVVHRRSGRRCEARASDGCAGQAMHVHHRKMRSQGGDNALSNLLDVCSACHKQIHNHPEESYLAGWLVHAWDDPVTVEALSGPRG